jgi:hypothetical protein
VIRRIFDDRPGHLRRKLGGIYAFLITTNVAARARALITFRLCPIRKRPVSRV